MNSAFELSQPHPDQTEVQVLFTEIIEHLAAISLLYFSDNQLVLPSIASEMFSVLHQINRETLVHACHVLFILAEAAGPLLPVSPKQAAVRKPESPDTLPISTSIHRRTKNTLCVGTFGSTLYCSPECTYACSGLKDWGKKGD